MKCPKCGYTSFDYNLTCPKCDRDISSEQEKLNLPPFRPDTPSLLGAVTEEADESRSDVGADSAEIDLAHDAEIAFDNGASHYDSSEVALRDSSDFELGSDEFSLDDASGLDSDSEKTSKDAFLGPEQDTGEAILDLGETLTIDKGISNPQGKSPKEDLRLGSESTEELDDLLSLEEITLEEVPPEQKPPILQRDKGKKESSAQDSELSLDLGDLDLELDLEESKPQG